MEFKDITHAVLQTQLDNLKDQIKDLSELTRRVAILEAVAVAEAPESLQAVQTIFNAADGTDQALVPEWDMPRTYDRETVEALEKDAYAAGYQMATFNAFHNGPTK
ncbi:hypothetical protein CDG24_25170 [Salmonella enterica subsp. enterica serovar Newport]|nr:hypothetical protein [Salmonella enterica subsp. enterica serovar Newport]